MIKSNKKSLHPLYQAGELDSLRFKMLNLFLQTVM